MGLGVVGQLSRVRATRRSSLSCDCSSGIFLTEVIIDNGDQGQCGAISWPSSSNAKITLFSARAPYHSGLVPLGCFVA